MNEQSLPPDVRTAWQRLRTTPLRDLLRGRLSGRLELDRVVHSANLPEPLAPLVTKAASSYWLAGRRAEFAQRMVQRLRNRLAAGNTPEELVLTLASPASTRGLFTRITPIAIIGDAGLPAELTRVIRTVTRRTRLWSSEQIDVAEELIDHFREGLSGGRTAEQLVTAFGDVRQASRLIRRARLRCRPLISRLGRVTWRLLAAGFLLFSAVSLLWLARFFLVHPTISHNYGVELVGSTQQVAQADRAWPLYREALSNFTEPPPLVTDSPNASADDDGSPENEPAQPAPDATTQLNVEATRPGDKNWGMVLEWLGKNRAALDAARQAAAKPRFGFFVDDPADDAWFKSVGYDRDQIDPRIAPEGLTMVFLPQAQALHNIRRLLVADGRRALDAGDAEAFVADVLSLVGVARQMRGDWPIWVFDHISFYDFQRALDLVDEMLAERPNLLDERKLAELAHTLVAYAGDGSIDLDSAGMRLMALDLVQRIYSDNAFGSGALTRDGLRLLRETGALASGDYSPTKDREPWLEKSPAGPAVTATAPSRRTMTRMLNEFLERGEREFRRPLWQWTDVEFARELWQMDLSQYDRAAFAPLVLLRWMPKTYYYGETVAQRRDATLVALALELYHRRHDAWPERLAELVPDLLPAVPPDRFTGEPLSYRLVDGRPQLYSVGPDKKDDGGRSLASLDDIFKLETFWPADEKTPVPTGDWILWPPDGETRPATR